MIYELFVEFERRREINWKREANLKRIEDESARGAFCLAAAHNLSQVSSAHRPWPPITYPPTNQRFVSSENLISWVAMPNLLQQDLENIINRHKVQVSEQDQARAEQLIRTVQIRE